jgi:hypothetical protein
MSIIKRYIDMISEAESVRTNMENELFQQWDNSKGLPRKEKKCIRKKLTLRWLSLSKI